MRPLTFMRQTQQPSLALYAALSAVGVLILALDLMTPLGVAVWILYVVPIGLTLFGTSPSVPIVAAAVAGRAGR